MSSSEPYQCVTHDHMKMVAKHLIHCLPVLSFLVFSFFFLFFFSFITNNISSSEPCQCATHDYMKMVAQHLIHGLPFVFMAHPRWGPGTTLTYNTKLYLFYFFAQCSSQMFNCKTFAFDICIYF